jgi:catechol 2,3-dioxygenase-like lactoylglutathione lyase family enzyme
LNYRNKRLAQQIAHISLVVKDYDEAIRFYVDVLGFTLLEDTQLTETKRWVRVAPNGSNASLLLAKADGSIQEQYIGNQTGGRVFLFLYTDDFERDFNLYTNRGVEFVRPPQKESYGTVAVFKDLYGNLWDLIQPA